MAAQEASVIDAMSALRELWAWLRRSRTWPIGHGLQAGDGAALDYLVAQRWLRHAPLAQAMNVSIEEAAASTQRLIQQGLVQLDPRGTYGIQPTFVPTPAADLFHAQMMAEGLERAKAMWADWSEEDLQALTQVIRRLCQVGAPEQTRGEPTRFSAPKPADALMDD